MAEHVVRPTLAEPWSAFSMRLAADETLSLFQKALAMSLALEEEWKAFVKGKTDPVKHFQVGVQKNAIVLVALSCTADAMPRIRDLAQTKRFGGEDVRVILFENGRAR